MNKYCVYCHISPSSKKYVGISCAPESRWNHGNGYKKNYLFYRAIVKYGWNNFEHIIIKDNLSANEAKELEAHLISAWKLTDPQYGYNIREGGDGSFSEASRKAMSQSRLGNKNCAGRKLPESTKAKISASLHDFYCTHPPTFLGKKHSAKTIQKLKSREFTAETRRKMHINHADVSGSNNPSAKKVRQLSLSGEPIRDFDYAKLAANEYNLDLSSIIKCCRGKQKTCGGFRWEYL